MWWSWSYHRLNEIIPSKYPACFPIFLPHFDSNVLSIVPVCQSHSFHCPDNSSGHCNMWPPLCNHRGCCRCHCTGCNAPLSPEASKSRKMRREQTLGPRMIAGRRSWMAVCSLVLGQGWWSSQSPLLSWSCKPPLETLLWLKDSWSFPGKKSCWILNL